MLPRTTRLVVALAYLTACIPALVRAQASFEAQVRGVVRDSSGSVVTGAKVTVTGQYGVSFSKASSGAEADPFMGVMDFQEMTIQEPAPALATLPGKKRKEPKK